ncbi:MAG: thioredoxin-dependent thiol peroxidase [Acidobacteria bacterium]|nr:MAG: thioredoxin-dependent thiol peroxidase [Acidobacteriota bacterium]
MPETGEKAPGFLLMNSKEKKVQLKDFKGKWLVLYFYPKDNTPGCTTEALDFTALKDKFKKAGAVVVGVSPDSCTRHRNFIDKKGLTVELLSDPEHQALERYGVWQLKKNYGREYFGVVRSTFLIDPEGVVVKVWPKVRVKGHAETVLDVLLKATK